MTSETAKLWRDMTADEKGALLLAGYEGETIQRWMEFLGEWRDFKGKVFSDDRKYRVKPKGFVITVNDELNW